MAANEVITKRVAIDKANTQMIIVLAVASFITVFCLIASKALLGQNAYQGRVTSASEKAHQQLLTNLKAYGQLASSYESFVSASTNVIGGQSNGNGSNDGNNSKIILDALPPSYDFPGLTSTLQKLLNSRSFNVASISGTDDQINQQTNMSSTDPKQVSIPFSFTVNNANYSQVGQLLDSLQSSVRPIQIDQMSVSGGGNSMGVTITAHTYYQPAKKVSITKRVIK